MNRVALSEGVFLYVLGLVIVATHTGRFLLGFSLALTPPLVGTVVRAFGAGGGRGS
jgi:hypothetical protein